MRFYSFLSSLGLTERRLLIFAGRVGHHSTSDDSFAYRARQEVEDWKRIGGFHPYIFLPKYPNLFLTPLVPFNCVNRLDNPHHRMRKFLESKSWWSEEEDETLKAAQKKAVMSSFQAAEKLSKPSLRNLFEDVYDEQPWNLVRSHSLYVVPLRWSFRLMGLCILFVRC